MRSFCWIHKLSPFLYFVDVSIDLPDFLDISHLRAKGLQPGEEELPDIAPPIIIPDDPKGIYQLLLILSCIPFPSSTRWFSLIWW